MGTYLDSIAMTVETCWVCGTVFGMTSGYARERQNDGKTFYCPNGDAIRYGKSRVRELEEKLARETHLREQETARLRDAVKYANGETARVEASLRSTKGVVTRIKNRVANGVCPCCNRTFADLGRHMKGQHPTWSTGDSPIRSVP